jgi:hypothetical protein
VIKMTFGRREMYFLIAGRPFLAWWQQQHLSASLFPV